MQKDLAIAVEHVSKRFGDLRALDDVSLKVESGEIFGVIGPNGAGKTTLVNLVTGMLEADSGSVRTLGLDPIRAEARLRNILGVQFQEAHLPELIRVDEALELYSSFYPNPQPWRPLAAEWGLGAKLGDRFGKLSGGQKQRLFICLALLNTPELVVLDELTTGLDPQARHQSWELVRKIRDNGATVLLVTHFMDEAEALCDRIAMIDHGNVVALGTPGELTSVPAGQRAVSFTAPDDLDLTGLQQFGEVTRRGTKISVTGGEFLMARVAGYLAQHELDPADLTTESSSLEDLFLRMTNHTDEGITV